MTNHHMERYSLDTRKTQIKITVRHHYIPIRMDSAHTHTHTHTLMADTHYSGKDVEKVDHPYLFGDNVKWCRHSGKEVGNFFKK
jgi:hypothetical protein